MSKKNKTPKYKPTGKLIGIDTGFIQAATLLDIAAANAIAHGTSEDMVEVADKWIELSMAMKVVLDPVDTTEEDEDHDHSAGRERSAPVGFGVTAKEIKDHHDRNH